MAGGLSQLAPFVAVTLWRTTPIGIVPHRAALPAAHEVAGDDPRADFALVVVTDGGAKTSARFELPFERDKLDTFLAAVNVAYGLGHRDRANRMRKLLGLAPACDVPNLTRCADERD